MLSVTVTEKRESMPDDNTPLLIRQKDGSTPFGVESSVITARNGTVWGSISNLMNSAIGAGILSLPFAFKSSGVGMGIILVVILAITCGYSLILIAQTAELYPQCTTYEKLVDQIYGPKWAMVVTASIILATLGACTGFLIIIGDLIPPVLEYWVPNASILHDRIFVTAIISVIFVIPLASQKHFHSLRFSSIIAISSILFVVVIIIIRFTQNNHLSSNRIVYFNNDFEVLAALPLICFALSCHMQMVPIHAEMEDHMSAAKIRTVSYGAQTVCSLLYTITGVFGYLSFFEETKGNIMENFADSDNLVNAGRIILSVVIVCHYPSSGHCLRASADYLFFRKKKESTLRRILLTIGVWVVCFALAISIPHIEIVFGFIGGTVGSILTFMFPGVFLYTHNTFIGWRGIKGKTAKILITYLIALSVLMFCVSTGITIYNLAAGKSGGAAH